MTNLKDDKITLKNLFNSDTNFDVLISILPEQKQILFKRSLNNLILTKINETLKDHFEDILIIETEILVFLY
jgi:hypothetical protein